MVYANPSFAGGLWRARRSPARSEKWRHPAQRPRPADGRDPGVVVRNGPLRRVLQPSLRPLLQDDSGRDRNGPRPTLSVLHGMARTVPGQRRQVAHGRGLRRPPGGPGLSPEGRRFGSDPLGIALGSLNRGSGGVICSRRKVHRPVSIWSHPMSWNGEVSASVSPGLRSHPGAGTPSRRGSPQSPIVAALLRLG